jgi:23S rRNA pseudouridine1911/1915/1917 synthase
MTLPSIIFEDKQLLIVEKPGGYLSQPADQIRPDILSWSKAFLKEKYSKPGNVFLALCHRLDKKVAGVMVFAKTSKAAERINKQFRERTTSKKYIALCQGEPSGSFGTFKDKLTRKGNITKPSLLEQNTRECILNWKLIKTSIIPSIGPASLFEVDLLTGFKHQIRTQFSLRGLPILGDSLYGAKPSPKEEPSIGLFSFELKIYHPKSHELLTFTAKPSVKIWPWKLWEEQSDYLVP